MMRVPTPRLRTLIRLAVSATLIGLLLWKYPISLEAVTNTFRSLDLALLILILALLFNQYVISCIKWGAILRSHGIRLPLAALIRSYMMGTFFSSFLPSSYMGDIVRIADVGRATGRSYESASAVVLERLSGLAALAFVGCLASFHIGGRFDEPVFTFLSLVFLAIVVILVAVFIPGVLELAEAVVRRVPVGILRRAFEKVAGAALHYRNRPRLLARVLLWSFAFQIMAYTIFYLYGRAVDIAIPYFYCFAFVPVVYLLEALPISIAGIGLREGGLIYFLQKVGYGASEAISLSILVVSCRYSMSLSGGLVFLLRGGVGRAIPQQSGRAGGATAAAPSELQSP